MAIEVTKARRDQYRRDPLLFFGDIVIPGSGGKCFRQVWAPFQEEFYRAVSPALLAASRQEEHEKKWFFLDRTKGTSKDSDVANLMLWLLAFGEKKLRIEFGAGKREQAGETKRAMEEVVGQNPWLEQPYEWRREVVRSTVNGSACYVIPADKWGAHGTRPDVTLFNELSHVDEARFGETMIANGMKKPWALVLLATNAGFVDTWQWKWRENARKDPEWWFQRVDHPAPWIPEKNIRQQEKMLPAEEFERLWHGIWQISRGQGIPTRQIMAAVRGGEVSRPEEFTGAKSPWVFAGGLDLGVKKDLSAFVTAGAQFKGDKVRVVRCRSWAPIDGADIQIEPIEEEVLRQFREWNHEWIWYDERHAEYLAQRLRDKGVPMRKVPFTAKEKNRMARSLLSGFANNQIELPNDKELIEDFKRLEFKQRVDDSWTFDAVADARGHADRAVAFAIVLPWLLEIATEVEPPPVDEDAEHIIEV